MSILALPCFYSTSSIFLPCLYQSVSHLYLIYLVFRNPTYRVHLFALLIPSNLQYQSYPSYLVRPSYLMCPSCSTGSDLLSIFYLFSLLYTLHIIYVYACVWNCIYIYISCVCNCIYIYIYISYIFWTLFPFHLSIYCTLITTQNNSKETHVFISFGVTLWEGSNFPASGCFDGLSSSPVDLFSGRSSCGETTQNATIKQLQLRIEYTNLLGDWMLSGASIFERRQPMGMKLYPQLSWHVKLPVCKVNIPWLTYTHASLQLQARSNTRDVRNFTFNQSTN